MNKPTLALLQAMLRSSSAVNKIKYSKDKKVRGRAIGSLVGKTILYSLLMFYSIIACVGFGIAGITSVIPASCALTVSMLALFFTFIKTNGYLFNFKEYDMLMSLPFEPKTIAACKFLYMYVNTLPWFISISWAMMIGYGIFARPSVLTYILWILLTFVLPVIPMLIAAFLGFIVAKISSNFRKSNVIQTIFMFALTIFAMSARFIIQSAFENRDTAEVVGSVSDVMVKGLTYYPPAKWFVDAIVDLNFLVAILLIIVTVALFLVVFIPVGKSYRKINSSFKNHAQAKKYKMESQHKRSVLNAIAFKEFRRMVGSTNYMVNAGVGYLLSILLGIAVLVVGFDKVVAIVTSDAPLEASRLCVAIPLIVYFLTGMVSTTTCSPSLEGKNYWIVQTLPISKKTLCKGKMLFNMYLAVPCGVFSTVCLCIAAKAPLLDSLLNIVEIIALSAFSTTWGLVCGLRFLKLEWENELEVIKQGVGLLVYLLPNMFIVPVLVVLVVFLGAVFNPVVVSLAIIVFICGLTALSYLRAMALTKKL